MRTISARDEALLSAIGRSVAIEVEVHDGSTWNNLSDLIDRDWVTSATWGDDNETPVGTLQLTLNRAVYEYNLSPLVATSPFNLTTPIVDIGYPVRVYVTYQPVGDPNPDASARMLMFEGAIDDLDMGGDDDIKARCRGLGYELQDDFIETQTTHGGASLEATIQDILDTHATNPPTLYTPVATGKTVTARTFEKEPVFDACRNLAQQIGAELKYRWDNGTSAFRLTLIVPDRTSPSVDRTFSADDVLQYNSAGISRVRIRNAIRVTYTDAAGVRAFVDVSDATSITRYGRRWMEIAEDSSSDIDTNAEATALANAALADLKDPVLGMSPEIDFFAHVQVGDYYTFEANADIYSADQSLAVVGYTHTIDANRATTQLRVRGTPSLGAKRWLELEARPGQAPGADFVGPDKPSNPAGTPDKGGVAIVYDKPTVGDWDHTEVHVFGPITTETDFTPTSSTLVARTKTDQFEVKGLEPGEDYLVKTIAVDVKGNKSTASDVQTIRSDFVNPIHANPDYDKVNMVYNGEFSVWTQPDGPNDRPPDIWESGTFDAGTGVWTADETDWDSGNVWYDQSAAFVESGSTAIKFLGNNGLRTTRLLPIPGGSVASFSCSFRSTAINEKPHAYIDFYDETGSWLGFSEQLDIEMEPTTINTYTKHFQTFRVPLGATQFAIGIERVVINPAHVVHVDRVVIRPEHPMIGLKGTSVVTTNVPSGVWTTLPYNNVVSPETKRQRGANTPTTPINWNQISHRYVSDREGHHAIFAQARVTDLSGLTGGAAQSFIQVRIVDAVSLITRAVGPRIPVNASPDPTYVWMTCASLRLFEARSYHIQVFHDDANVGVINGAVPPTIVDGEANRIEIKFVG